MVEFSFSVPHYPTGQSELEEVLSVVEDDEIGCRLEEIWCLGDQILRWTVDKEIVCLDLRYEFSYLFDEFLSFCEWVFSRDEGAEKFDLHVDTFGLTLNVEKCRNKDVRMGFFWADVRDVSRKNYQSIKYIDISSGELSVELKKVMFFVERSLRNSGFIYPRLHRILSKI